MIGKKKGRRTLYFCVFFLLTVLLAGTIAFADGGGSYSLTIEKVLAGTVPNEALSKNYQFKVSGKLGRSRDTSFTSVKTIRGAGELVIDLGDTYYVSAVEDGASTQIEGYDLQTVYSGSMDVTGKKATVEINKDGGAITISKPEGAAGITYTYDITGPDSYQREVKVLAGSQTTVDNLPIGEYTVVKRGSSAGFSVNVDNPNIQVPAGQSYTIDVIDQYHGTLSVTAPNDGRVHHYTLKDSRGNIIREAVAVQPGETYTSDHVSAGSYTAEEVFKQGKTPFTVTAPLSEGPELRIAHTNSGSTSYKNYTLPEWAMSADYFTLRMNGLSTTLAKDTQYRLYVRGYWSDEPDVRSAWYTTLKAGYYYNSILSKVNLLPGDGTVSLRVLGTDGKAISSSTLKSLNVYLLPHDVEMSYSFEDTSTPHTITIDERGWLEFSKPADNTSGAEYVSYLFSISNSSGYSNAITLRAGETKKVENLTAGDYTITQTIQSPTPAPYTLRKQTSASTSGANDTLKCALVTEDGEITLSKPSYDDGGREYHFLVTGPAGSGYEETVTVRSGESKTWKPGYPGTYSISALDDEDNGFHLDFTNSCTVTTIDGANAKITVTNTYTPHESSYNIVHEYYGVDGQLEDISTITYNRPGDMNAPYYASGVTEMPKGPNTGYDYVFYEAAYGALNSEEEPTISYSVNYYVAGVLNQERSKTFTYAAKPDQTTVAVNDGISLSLDGYDLEEIKVGGITVWPNENGDSSADCIPSEVANGTEIALYFVESQQTLSYTVTYFKDGEQLSSNEISDNVPISQSTLPVNLDAPEEGCKVEKILVNGESVTEAPTSVEGGDEIEVYWVTDPTPAPNGDTPAQVSEDPDASDSQDNSDNPDDSSSQDGSDSQDASGNQDDANSQNDSSNQDDAGNQDDSNDDQDGSNNPDDPDSQSDGNADIDDEDVPEADGPFDPSSIYSQYTAETGKTSAIATPEGDEIIILRYRRTQTSVQEGSYKYVHVYYLRDQNGDTEETHSQLSTVGNLPITFDVTYDAQTVDKVYTPTASPYNQYTYTYDGATYGVLRNDETWHADSNMEYVVAKDPDVEQQVIILRYYRTLTPTVGSYKYVHVYYTIDGENTVKDGQSAIESVGDLPINSTYTDETVVRQPIFNGNEYTYFKTEYGLTTQTPDGFKEQDGMQCATATESGDQIIILKYIRHPDSTPNPDPTPTPDPKPDPTPIPDPKPDPTPTPDPEPDPAPTPDPEPDPAPTPDPEPNPAPTPDPEPETPSYPTELPDPNDPDSPLTLTILEDGVPKTYVKVWNPETEEWEYIPEDEVPLGSLETPGEAPRTGDDKHTVAWAIVTVGALGGLTVLTTLQRKKKENDQ